MDIFSPVRVGPLELPNRIVMAPMARARCNADNAANELVAEYYAQRASAGLVITEAGSVSPNSVSRANGAAIYREHHSAGWHIVADKVHGAGGRVFQQIYHLGRKADPSRMPGGAQPLSASAIAAKGQINGLNGMLPFAVPRALETAEIPGVVDEFRNAAELSKKAGMDGVELHGANGYLIDQFLRSGSNVRTDAYGGPIGNRARFLMEITDAAIAVFGRDRVGVRFAPHATADGIADADPVATFAYAAAALNERGIAYVHLIESIRPGLRQSPSADVPAVLPALRKAFTGPLIVNGGYDKAAANEAIASGLADLVAFAVPFISNPDLVERMAQDAPLNPADATTFYEGGAKGYTDYPSMRAKVSA